ncbi:hypothetical protein [Paraburkholderia dinghuensis]|uniref:Uncharacterized protein n=1 Tax=Paraburkholderia dinghuensis TaxID=2305225 RepID=A0A3N6N089_9BURK|nr:hypothetical protein [Paraburkholderia dinghuensis]RQH03901.1 hypothetical protein D1Y85_19895 [Paraburkholderia dinghuensis]
MRQTVTGRFKTWNDAVHAQDVLMLKGFAAGDIELPAHSSSVLAGIERLIGSFFANDPLARGGHDAEHAPMAPGDMVLVGVHVADEDHAELARDTLRDEHAIDIATRGPGWAWATQDTPVAREHSALEELGLAGLANAVRQRVAAASSPTPAAERKTADLSGSGNPGNEAEATVLTAASAPGAGAVMGHHVDVPGAPEATRPAKDAAPQIPDEFLEYEDDTPAHHRTLH